MAKWGGVGGIKADPDNYFTMRMWWNSKGKRSKDIDWVRLPLGTVFYPAVEVLEQKGEEREWISHAKTEEQLDMLLRCY